MDRNRATSVSIYFEDVCTHITRRSAHRGWTVLLREAYLYAHSENATDVRRGYSLIVVNFDELKKN